MKRPEVGNGASKRSRTQPLFELKNTITPRLFVAATRQDVGKTTTCIGLFRALQDRFPRIGYIKPVGQRTIEVDGAHIDEDSILFNQTYQVKSPLRAMSPIAVVPDFTRKYLLNGNSPELHRQVQDAFDEAAWEKDFILIEGTGHAGVGSVFDLSNAEVAKLCNAKALIVAQGGIGRPVDEVSMNLALFNKHHVEVLGVVINKVHPAKIDEITEFVTRGLERFGLPLLGVIPYDQELRKPTMNQVCEQVSGTFLAGKKHNRRRVGRFKIAAMSSRNIDEHIAPGNLIITAGDRDDIVLTILGKADENKPPVAGVLLTGGWLPSSGVLEVLEQHDIPFVSTELDIYTVASAVNKMTVKTEVGDNEKIDRIQQIVSQNVDLDRILKLCESGEPNQMPLL